MGRNAADKSKECYNESGSRNDFAAPIKDEITTDRQTDD